MLSDNQEKLSLLLGDIGELAEANEDVYHLPEEFHEDFFAFRVKIHDSGLSEEVTEEFLAKNPIIVEVRETCVLFSFGGIEITEIPGPFSPQIK